MVTSDTQAVTQEELALQDKETSALKDYVTLTLLLYGTFENIM
jgi:hypothetical protein